MAGFQEFQAAVAGVQPMAKCAKVTREHLLDVKDGQIVRYDGPWIDKFQATLRIAGKSACFVVDNDNFDTYEVAVMADEMMERLK